MKLTLIRVLALKEHNMKSEEKLVGQLVKVNGFKNNENKITKIIPPQEMVVAGCFKDEKLEGFIINGGYFMSAEESEDYL